MIGKVGGMFTLWWVIGTKPFASLGTMAVFFFGDDSKVCNGVGWIEASQTVLWKGKLFVPWKVL
jgi:hypothetical protein